MNVLVSLKKMSKAEEIVQEYLKEHNIPKIINNMLNTLIQTRKHNPLIFMVMMNISIRSDT